MTGIIIAAAIVGGTGIIIGLFLGLSGEKLKVEVDEKEVAIREALPGSNCGGCGYAGCEDYAKAIKNGEAKPNLCSAGGEAVYKDLCSVLGIGADAEMLPKKAFIFCGGCIDYTEDKMKYQGMDTCKGENMYFQGKGKCDFGCLGIGDCAAACPSQAICVKDGIAHVDTSRCLGCGLCTNICPHQIISLVPQETAAVVMCSNKDKGADARKACKNACIGCKKCEKVCAVGAVSVDNQLAVIDYDRCVGCGACAKECPIGALKKVFFPDLPDDAELSYD